MYFSFQQLLSCYYVLGAANKGIAQHCSKGLQFSKGDKHIPNVFMIEGYIVTTKKSPCLQRGREKMFLIN